MEQRSQELHLEDAEVAMFDDDSTHNLTRAQVVHG